jgi:hydroxymethylbilane synthase
MARWQTDHVIARLAMSEPGPLVEALVVSTEADRRLDLAISELGGKGAFAKEVQMAVLDRRADMAVHSAKDLPSTTPDGLVVAAVLERHDPRDALVGGRLADLAPGARVGTGSPRRRAQLAWLRPDLTFAEVRGNVGTRLGRLDAGQVDVLVLAVSGLRRLGLGDRVAEVLEPSVMLPQVAQGTLCVECREDDLTTRTLLAGLDHAATRRAFEAERSFLVALGGDCYLPAGALATLGPAAPADPAEKVGPADPEDLAELQGPAEWEEMIELEGMIASLDGHVVLRHRARGPDPAALGPQVAAHLLDRSGGRELLER